MQAFDSQLRGAAAAPTELPHVDNFDGNPKFSCSCSYCSMNRETHLLIETTHLRNQLHHSWVVYRALLLTVRDMTEKHAIEVQNGEQEIWRLRIENEHLLRENRDLKNKNDMLEKNLHQHAHH